MKNILALLISLISTGVYAGENLIGNYAKRIELCDRKSNNPGDWFQINNNGMYGHGFACVFLNKIISNNMTTVDAVCEADGNEHNSLDRFSMYKSNNMLSIRFDNMVKTFNSCE